MKKFQRILFCAIALAVLVFSVCGCNTWAGVGKDVQRGGEAIENSAE